VASSAAFLLPVRAKETRFLVYAAPGLAILVGYGIVRLSRLQGHRLSIPLILAAGAAVIFGRPPLAGRWWGSGGPSRANSLSANGIVMYAGRCDGPFILYRRLDDGELRTITIRADKPLGGSNIRPWRSYSPFVKSPEEIRQKLFH